MKYFESFEQVKTFKTSKVFLSQKFRQVTDLLGVKKVLIKMINRHILQFKKYNANNKGLFQEPLAHYSLVLLSYTS